MVTVTSTVVPLLPAAEWAQSMPLSRFRLVGSSLYELGTTEQGAFVDRYDLGVS